MSYGIEPKAIRQTQIIKHYSRKSRTFNNERTKRTDEQWKPILQKLAKDKGYITTNDLRQFSTTDKDTPIILAHRLVGRGLLFRGKFRPQRYYLTAEEAAQAIAEKPPRKTTDFSQIKCKVMQAQPTRQLPPLQSQEFTHKNNQNEPSSDCTNLTFNQLQVITALDQATGAKSHIRWQNYGLLGRMALDAFGIDSQLLPQLFDALDAIISTPLTVHNLGWKFRTPVPPDPALFKDIPLRNKPLPSRHKLPNGTLVTLQRFPSGRVSTQTRLTDNPIAPEDAGELMNTIRSSLALETPSTSAWEITTTDAAHDIPIPARALRGFKLPEFEYNGAKIHIYRRRVNGAWHLRIESHEKPHIMLSDYSTYLQAVAEPRILGVCGKDFIKGKETTAA